MNRKGVWAFLGVLILSLGGCSSGKNYWLVYNHNPNVVPEATYQGYYSDATGENTDDAIEKCVMGITGPSQPLPGCGAVIKVIPGKKPPLTDDDQAKVVVKVDPNKIPLNELECEIKQTKITRSPFSVFSSDSLDKNNRKLPLIDIKPSVYFCDLHVTDAGGMRLDYAVQQAKPKVTPPVPKKNGEDAKKETGAEIQNTTITLKSAVVNDSIEVHTLYRFRVLIGPVYSSLSQKDRAFTAKAHSGGESFVSSSVNGNPVNAAVFLKYYWRPRDVYDTKFCPKQTKTDTGGKTWLNWDTALDCLGRINPIVGLSVSDHPLQNVYVGGSLDILPGLDIVGGAHWSPVETLSGGFVPGQTVPNNTTIPTEKRILPGWFVGIAVDTGVAATWITKATTSLFK